VHQESFPSGFILTRTPAIAAAIAATMVTAIADSDLLHGCKDFTRWGKNYRTLIPQVF